MATSTDRDEGTSNVERIRAEVQKAAQQVSRLPEYQELLVGAAIDCYLLTAEHDEQRININQQYDEVINLLAQAISQTATNRGEA